MQVIALGNSQEIAGGKNLCSVDNSTTVENFKGGRLKSSTFFYLCQLKLGAKPKKEAVMLAAGMRVNPIFQQVARPNEEDKPSGAVIVPKDPKSPKPPAEPKAPTGESLTTCTTYVRDITATYCTKP